jgi:hypothetical protein
MNTVITLMKMNVPEFCLCNIWGCVDYQDTCHYDDFCEAINEIHPLYSFIISPKPATNTVTISVDKNITPSQISITDITDRTILTVPLNTQSLTLNTSNFAKGVYLVRLTNCEDISVVKKLVRE